MTLCLDPINVVCLFMVWLAQALSLDNPKPPVGRQFGKIGHLYVSKQDHCSLPRLLNSKHPA